MIIKKITDKRVKVLIEAKDIRDYKVPYQRLNTADDQSAEFIYKILLKILEETGISFLENALILEATPACGGNYYITITVGNDPDTPLQLRKSGGENDEMRIFLLQHPDHIRGMQKILAGHPTLLPSESSLYLYQNRLYCTMEFSPMQLEHPKFAALMLQLNEYGLPCRTGVEYEGILVERGKMIDSAVFKPNDA